MLTVKRQYKSELNGAEAYIGYENNPNVGYTYNRIRVRMSFNGNPFSDMGGFRTYEEAEEAVLCCDSMFHRVIDGRMLPRPEWADEKLYIKKYELMETAMEMGEYYPQYC
jgi:hypothetical protein